MSTYIEGDAPLSTLLGPKSVGSAPARTTRKRGRHGGGADTAASATSHSHYRGAGSMYSYDRHGGGGGTSVTPSVARDGLVPVPAPGTAGYHTVGVTSSYGTRRLMDEQTRQRRIVRAQQLYHQHTEYTMANPLQYRTEVELLLDCFLEQTINPEPAEPPVEGGGSRSQSSQYPRSSTSHHQNVTAGEEEQDQDGEGQGEDTEAEGVPSKSRRDETSALPSGSRRHRSSPWFRPLSFFTCTACDTALSEPSTRPPTMDVLKTVYHHCGMASHRKNLRDMFPDTGCLRMDPEAVECDPEGFVLVHVNGIPTLVSKELGGGGHFTLGRSEAALHGGVFQQQGGLADVEHRGDELLGLGSALFHPLAQFASREIVFPVQKTTTQAAAENDARCVKRTLAELEGTTANGERLKQEVDDGTILAAALAPVPRHQRFHDEMLGESAGYSLPMEELLQRAVTRAMEYEVETPSTAPQQPKPMGNEWLKRNVYCPNPDKPIHSLRLELVLKKLHVGTEEEAQKALAKAQMEREKRWSAAFSPTGNIGDGAGTQRPRQLEATQEPRDEQQQDDAPAEPENNDGNKGSVLVKGRPVKCRRKAAVYYEGSKVYGLERFEGAVLKVGGDDHQGGKAKKAGPNGGKTMHCEKESSPTKKQPSRGRPSTSIGQGAGTATGVGTSSSKVDPVVPELANRLQVAEGQSYRLVWRLTQVAEGGEGQDEEEVLLENTQRLADLKGPLPAWQAAPAGARSAVRFRGAASVPTIDVPLHPQHTQASATAKTPGSRSRRHEKPPEAVAETQQPAGTPHPGKAGPPEESYPEEELLFGPSPKERRSSTRPTGDGQEGPRRSMAAAAATKGGTQQSQRRTQSQLKEDFMEEWLTLSLPRPQPSAKR